MGKETNTSYFLLDEPLSERVKAGALSHVKVVLIL